MARMGRRIAVGAAFDPVVARRDFLSSEADNSAGPERCRMAGSSFLMTVLLGAAALGGLAMMVAGIAAELRDLAN
jgi:hypothetical protein